MTAQLDGDQQLNTDDKLVEGNNTTTLIMQGDGNLVLYRNNNNVALWSSNTPGKPVTHAIMQADGNFVCYGDNGIAYFSTGTWGNPGSFIILQDDGNPHGLPAERGISVGLENNGYEAAKLDANQQLNINDKLVAENNRTTLIMQGDGNLVLYRTFDSVALWSSNTPGKPVTHAVMQADGNFVCYDDNGIAYFSTGTGQRGSSIILQRGYGNLVVYGPPGVETYWTSNTAQNWDLANPGPPAILVELFPAALVDLTDANKLAKSIDEIQSAVAPVAQQLQSAGLALAGPSVIAANNPHDNVSIVRAGLGYGCFPPLLPVRRARS